MKTFWKILRYLFGVLLLALLVAFVAIQSPAVQTRVADRVTSKLGEDLEGIISFESVSLTPFRTLVLKNAVILDDNPVNDFKRLDTLATVGELSATFTIRSLIAGNGIHLNRVQLKNACLNLAIEDGIGKRKGTNLERILKLGDNKSSGLLSHLFDIDRVVIRNFRFRMVNFKLRHKQGPFPDYAMDWNDLDLGMDLRAHGLCYSHGIFSGVVDALDIAEKCGYNASLSGAASVGNGKTIIRNLKILDSASELNLPELKLLYKDSRAFGDFIKRVRIHAVIAPSLLDMGQTISRFAPELITNSFRGKFQGTVDGPVADLLVKDISFTDETSCVWGTATCHVTGLPDVHAMELDFKVDDLNFTMSELSAFVREWAPDVSMNLSGLAPGHEMSFRGSGHGTLDNLHIKGSAGSSGLGSAVANLVLTHLLPVENGAPIGIAGRIFTNNLNAGKIIGNDILGPVTMGTKFDARFPGKRIDVKIDSASVSRLNAMGYDYSDIMAVGTYANDRFNGRIVCHDPNLNFMFKGLFSLSSRTGNAAYKFDLNIGYADLNALNIDRRGRSRISLGTTANFMFTGKDVLGDIAVRDIDLENSEGRYRIGDINAQSHSNNDVNRIKFTSRFAEGSFVGSRPILSMFKDIKTLTVDTSLPALTKARKPKWDPASYNLSFIFHDSRDLFSFLAPGIYIADSTSVGLKIVPDGTIDASLSSKRLAFNDKWARNVSFKADNRKNSIQAILNCPDAKIAGFRLKDNKISAKASSNKLDAAYTFDNGDGSNADFRLGGTVSRTRDDSLHLALQALPSLIRYNGRNWRISSGDVNLESGLVSVASLLAGCEDQQISIDGGLSAHAKDTLTLRLDRFDIATVSDIIDKNLDLRGRATGKCYVISPTKPNIGLMVNMVCDSTYIAGQKAGTLRLASSWNEKESRFDLGVRNELDGKRNINANGYIKPEDGEVKVDADLDGLNLGYAAPFLTSIFSEVQGNISGKVGIDGTLDEIDYHSDGLRLDNGLLKLDYTQVPYYADGPVELDNDGLWFRNLAIKDRTDGIGTINGGLTFDRLRDLGTDISIEIEDMEVLDLPETPDASFYGTVYATGRVGISGPVNSIFIDIDASTSKEGDFHIPLAGGGSQNSDLLTFLKEEVVVEQDPYELIMGEGAVRSQEANDLNLKLRVRATPETTAYVEIDKASGNVLSGEGSGQIDIDVRTRTNTFTINGDYTLTSGNYKFSAMNIVSRDFNLKDGSSIRFNGDVMDSDLNIDGEYITKTTLSNLLSDTTSIATHRTVECGIHISDKLINPQVQFSINIPDLDPTTQSQVDAALNTTDKVQKQFVYLLIANDFLPAEESGIVNNSPNMLLSNVTNIMSNQLNNIFQRLGIPLDLGFNYRPTERGNDIFDVALGTQLWNNRIVLNGNFGNRQYSTGNEATDLVGDLDAEIKLSRDGNLRFNVFTHSADDYTSYLDNSQRTGVGLVFQQEFNNLSDLWKRISNFFTKKEDRTVEEEVTGSVNYIIDSDGKAVEIPGDE